MASILVIEDHDGVRVTLGYYLASKGHSVSCAVDGIEGMELAAERPFDLILLDVDMPRMNGFALCAVLQRSTSLCRIPVVMMSGRASRELEELAVRAGARALLRKPFDFDLLVRTIARCVQQAGASSVAVSAHAQQVGQAEE